VGERAARWRAVSSVLREHNQQAQRAPPVQEVMEAMVLNKQEREQFR